jgi:hypothetical protein
VVSFVCWNILKLFSIKFLFFFTLGNEFNNGKNCVAIEERARRVYKPSRSAFFDSATEGNNHNPDSPKTEKEKKTLQSLEIFDRFDAENATSAKNTADGKNRTAGSFSHNEKTPAWRTPQDLFKSTGSLVTNGDDGMDDQNDNNMQRVRLDEIEFDEQELFDNFKPIFDFNNPEPNYAIDYPTTLNKSGKTNTIDPELYGYPSSPSNTNANNYNGNNNSNANSSNYYKLKSNLQVDQTADLLI